MPALDLDRRPKPRLFTLDLEAQRRAGRPRQITSASEGRRIDDPLVAESRVLDAETGRMPELLLDFDGLPSTIVGPPDSEGAVGPAHYVQAVNIAFRVFDKQGRPLTGPIATNSLWAGTASVCASELYADPIVVYDEAAGRWVVTYLAAVLGEGIFACMAVSTDGDPTGDYFLYEVRTPGVPDYPKVGVWPDPVHDAYLLSTIPGPQGTFDVFAIDRASLLAGSTPRPSQRFSGNPNLMMPADLDGGRPAPAGTPGIFYTFRDGGDDFFIPGTPVDTLDLYELAIDWGSPAHSRLTRVQSFSPPELADFNWTVCGRDDQGECLSQPGTDQKIDSLSWLPMQRLQYRNLGAYETLVGVWTVNATANGQHAALRWFELRRSGASAWEIAHQGTFAPDGSHRWMGSVALDGSGNMALGYNVVDAAAGIYPSLRATFRPRDSGRFAEEVTLVAGTGFVDGLARWGDYSSMEVDPADGCTFWFTGEYVATSGLSDWSTRIIAFRVPGCTGWLTPDPHETGSVTDE